MYDDSNRPCRHRPPRPDEPRSLGPPGSGRLAHDGYHVVVRRPRVAGYPDYVSPERATEVESIVRHFDGPMIDDDY